MLAYVNRGVAWPADYQPVPALAALRLRAPQLRIPLELPIRARRDHLDLLHVTYVAPPMAGLPLVTTIHDLSFEDHPEFFRRATRLRLRTLVRLAARRSAAVIAISQFTRERLIDVYSLAPERVHHVPVGVGRQWQPMDVSQAARLLEPLGVTVGSRFVAAVGTAHPRKNLARVIAAVGMVRESQPALQPALQLVLCGPFGPEEPAIAAAIRDARGAGWVSVPGYVTDEVLRALYSTSSAVVFASLYEGFGLPVLEAMACGATVVASSTTATREAAGEAAVTIDPTDTASIAAGIRTAIEDESLRGTLREQTREHLKGFDWDATAAATVDVYRVALGPHHRAAKSR